MKLCIWNEVENTNNIIGKLENSMHEDETVLHEMLT